MCSNWCGRMGARSHAMSKVGTIKKVEAICTACGGTGLYEGFCEVEGYPVVCLRCGGTGCERIVYVPFVKRRLRKGVKGVSLSQGSFIVTGVGSTGDNVTYQEFLDGKLKYNER